MIGHAAMLYRTQFGRQPKSLAEMVEARCCAGVLHRRAGRPGPGFAALPLRRQVCPLGRRHDRRLLASRPRPAVGSRPGNPPGTGDRGGGRAVPAVRRGLQPILADGTSIRSPSASKSSPKQYRVETIILPLIDNSIYTGLAGVLGGEPESLDALPVPQRNIFSVARAAEQGATAEGDADGSPI